MISAKRASVSSRSSDQNKLKWLNAWFVANRLAESAGDIDIAYKIDRYTPDLMALNNASTRTDFRLRAHRNRRKEQRQREQ
jgi:hypothetical protein